MSAISLWTEAKPVQTIGNAVNTQRICLNPNGTQSNSKITNQVLTRCCRSLGLFKSRSFDEGFRAF
jgi:hypothetical protein